MKYQETVLLKDNRVCVLRNGVFSDGKEALDLFILTHEQTDFLLSYPDECTKTPEGEGAFLQRTTDSDNELELVATVDGKVVGLAGFNAFSSREKTRHRADFGISIDRAYWNLGIGRAMTKACIDAAKTAGYEQIELEVVADNAAAIALYHKLGFVEWGRNPRGFRSRSGKYQELICMRMEL